MAQRKPPKTPSPTNKPASGRPDAKPAAGRAAGRTPPKRKPGKSIVNQKQTPWGLIAVTAVIVVFAGLILGYVFATHKSKPAANGNCTKMIGNNQTTYLNELKCAADIQGLTFKQEPNRDHVQGVIQYDSTPPVGGNHSQYWADCTGTLYSQPIANANAVHMLEHGAIWITYNAKTLPADQLSKLQQVVSGHDRMALSPYPDLKSPISLQAWGYQLFVDKATDPRIEKFITALRYNPLTTPEYGATCSQPTFKEHPSTFGHPLWEPASGSGNTMP